MRFPYHGKRGRTRDAVRRRAPQDKKLFVWRARGNVELETRGVRMIPDGDTIVSCKGVGRESIRWESAEERERTKLNR